MPVVFEQERVRLPDGLTTLEAFRRWTRSDDFPERGRYTYMGGELWVDMSMEDLYLHNQVRAKIGFTLQTLIEATNAGLVIPDRMRLVHVEAELSCEPDLMYFSFEAQRSGRVVVPPRSRGGKLEVVGSPEMTLEVLSDSSEEKDTEELPVRYWLAGVQEYWLVDVRRDGLRFDISRRGAKRFATRRPRDGWVKSDVFGRSFRLVRGVDPAGEPRFALEVRP